MYKKPNGDNKSHIKIKILKTYLLMKTRASENEYPDLLRLMFHLGTY